MIFFQLGQVPNAALGGSSGCPSLCLTLVRWKKIHRSLMEVFSLSAVCHEQGKMVSWPPVNRTPPHHPCRVRELVTCNRMCLLPAQLELPAGRGRCG